MRRSRLRPTPPTGDGALQGNRSTIDALYRRYWAELCHYLRKTFGAGPPEPEDIAQLTFIHFAKHCENEAVDNPRAYLYRTAHNLTVDEIRRCSARHRAVIALFPQTERKGDEFTPERVLVAEEQLDVLVVAIRAMPEARRSSFLYNRLHGLNVAEISRRTGYAESSVRKHIMLAMADLQAAQIAAERSKMRKGS